MIRSVVLVGLVVLGSFGCAAPVASSRTTRAVASTGERPVTVRAEAGVLWASPRPTSTPRRAWATPGAGPIEALSLETLPSGGHAVRLVQGGVEWRGELDETLHARGPLTTATPAPYAVASVAGEER